MMLLTYSYNTMMYMYPQIGWEKKRPFWSELIWPVISTVHTYTSLVRCPFSGGPRGLMDLRSFLLDHVT